MKFSKLEDMLNIIRADNSIEKKVHDTEFLYGQIEDLGGILCPVCNGYRNDGYRCSCGADIIKDDLNYSGRMEIDCNSNEYLLNPDLDANTWIADNYKKIMHFKHGSGAHTDYQDNKITLRDDNSDKYIISFADDDTIKINVMYHGWSTPANVKLFAELEKFAEEFKHEMDVKKWKES